MDKRTSKLASILVNYSLNVKRGEIILISAHIDAAPLVKELIRRILIKQAHPIYELSTSDLERTFYQTANKTQLEFIPKFASKKSDEIDKIIDIYAERNTRIYSTLDPKKSTIRSKAFHKRGLTDPPDTMVCFPTEAYAQDAGMSLDEYESFFYKATNRNWNSLSQKWKECLVYFRRSKEIRITGHETDLTFSVGGRKFALDDGKQNMPGGEIFTSPLEKSVNGHIFFDLPTVYDNVEVNKVKLVFEAGRVIEANADYGEEYLHKVLDMDEGARYLGEFAVGLNYNIKNVTKEILFDEKIGGSIHLALGNSFPECKGRNKSVVHWDLIKNMKNGGKIYTDGKIIYKNGRFLR